MQGAVHEIVNQSSVAEPHFMLGRVDVDIHPARIKLQEQHERGMPAVEKHVGIRLAHGVRDDPVLHRATVDVEVLLVGART